MKILKPMRLGVMPRPFTWQRKHYLSLTLYAHVDLAAEPTLLNEQHLWPMLAAELGSTAVLDLGLPKRYPEFLVSGHAYTAHQADKTRCAVRATVGCLDKRLTVFGDRYWIAGGASAPHPFDSLPLGWEHAFGGAAFPANPLGRGHGTEQVAGQQVLRLPNVESTTRLWTSPSSRSLEPAGMGPIDIGWPQRQQRMGRHDAAWLEHDFPGFPSTLDWRAFNAAPDDQQFAADYTLAGRDYAFHNMHPEHALLAGHIPDWQGRCLVVRRERGQELREDLDLRLSTAWFFPHRRECILLYHASIAITEDDAHDVVCLMPALEHRGRPRAQAHFDAVLAQRLDSKHGASYAFRDIDLLPDGVPLGALVDNEDTLFSQEAGPRERNRRAKLAGDQARTERELRARGADPTSYMPATQAASPPMPRSLDDLPRFLHEADAAHAAELGSGRASLQQMKGQLGQLPEAQRRHYLGMIEQLSPLLDGTPGAPAKSQAAAPTHTYRQATTETARLMDVAKASGSAATAPPGMDADAVSRQMRSLYAQDVSSFAPAPAMPAAEASLLRERLAAFPGQGAGVVRDFKGIDLSGADLSGLDLRGADFSNAILESANLAGARLDDCNFSDAVLARARLAGACLARTSCDKANFAQADLRGAVFTGARLAHVVWDEAQLDGCDFSDALLSNTDFEGARLEACSFNGASLKTVNFHKTALVRCSFVGAKVDKAAFIECSLDSPSYAGARLDCCAWIQSTLSGASFRGAAMDCCVMVQDTTSRKADFTDARMSSCNFRGMALERSDFSRAVLRQTDFSEAALTGSTWCQADASSSIFIRAGLAASDMRSAILIDAILHKADLCGADLRHANLFRTDLAQTLGDGATRFDGAYLERTKFLPRRQEAAA